MLFNVKDELFESVKERNLYGKFFAGYFFNELVPGLEKRIKSFTDLLNGNNKDGEKVIINEDYENSYDFQIELDIKNTHISFDNHSFYIIDKKDADRGEFADILIHDKKNSLLISIEAKYLSDWTIDKDIVENRKRLEAVADKLGIKKRVHCLLITDIKKRNGSNKSNSYYNKVVNDYKDYPVIILTWEMLLKACDNEDVIKYMEYMLSKTKPEDFRL